MSLAGLRTALPIRLRSSPAWTPPQRRAALPAAAWSLCGADAHPAMVSCPDNRPWGGGRLTGPNTSRRARPAASPIPVTSTHAPSPAGTQRRRAVSGDRSGAAPATQSAKEAHRAEHSHESATYLAPPVIHRGCGGVLSIFGVPPRHRPAPLGPLATTIRITIIGRFFLLEERNPRCESVGHSVPRVRVDVAQRISLRGGHFLHMRRVPLTPACTRRRDWYCAAGVSWRGYWIGERLQAMVPVSGLSKMSRCSP